MSLELRPQIFDFSSDKHWRIGLTDEGELIGYTSARVPQEVAKAHAPDRLIAAAVCQVADSLHDKEQLQTIQTFMSALLKARQEKWFPSGDNKYQKNTRCPYFLRLIGWYLGGYGYGQSKGYAALEYIRQKIAALPSTNDVQVIEEENKLEVAREKNEADSKLKSCLQVTKSKAGRNIQFEEVEQKEEAAETARIDEFLEASRKGDLIKVRSLFEQGVPIDSISTRKKNDKGSKESVEPTGPTALILAIQNNHLEVVQFLVDNKADVNAKSKGRSVLLEATLSSPAILCVLLAQKELRICDPITYKKNGSLSRGTVRTYLIEKQPDSLAIGLLEGPETVEHKRLFDFRTKMFEVILKGDPYSLNKYIPIVKEYFDVCGKVASLDEIKEYITDFIQTLQGEIEIPGQTIWHFMVCFPDCLELIMLFGVQNPMEQTPLIDLLKLFRLPYDKLSQQNSRGQTPLHVAAKRVEVTKEGISDPRRAVIFHELCYMGDDKFEDFEGNSPKDLVLQNYKVEEEVQTARGRISRDAGYRTWFNYRKKVCEAILQYPETWEKEVSREEWLVHYVWSKRVTGEGLANIDDKPVSDQDKIQFCIDEYRKGLGDHLAVKDQTIWHFMVVLFEYDCDEVFPTLEPNTVTFEDLNKKNADGKTPIDLAPSCMKDWLLEHYQPNNLKK